MRQLFHFQSVVSSDQHSCERCRRPCQYWTYTAKANSYPEDIIGNVLGDAESVSPPDTQPIWLRIVSETIEGRVSSCQKTLPKTFS